MNQNYIIIKPFFIVGLHMLTTVYKGRFAIVNKRHYYMTNSSSDIVKQVSVNGGASHNHNEDSASVCSV